jgi:hypothetical protein
MYKDLIEAQLQIQLTRSMNGFGMSQTVKYPDRRAGLVDMGVQIQIRLKPVEEMGFEQNDDEDESEDEYAGEEGRPSDLVDLLIQVTRFYQPYKPKVKSYKKKAIVSNYPLLLIIFDGSDAWKIRKEDSSIQRVFPYLKVLHLDTRFEMSFDINQLIYIHHQIAYFKGRKIDLEGVIHSKKYLYDCLRCPCPPISLTYNMLNTIKSAHCTETLRKEIECYLNWAEYEPSQSLEKDRSNARLSLGLIQNELVFTDVSVPIENRANEVLARSVRLQAVFGMLIDSPENEQVMDHLVEWIDTCSELLHDISRRFVTQEINSRGAVIPNNVGDSVFDTIISKYLTE